MVLLRLANDSTDDLDFKFGYPQDAQALYEYRQLLRVQRTDNTVPQRSPISISSSCFVTTKPLGWASEPFDVLNLANREASDPRWRDRAVEDTHGLVLLAPVHTGVITDRDAYTSSFVVALRRRCAEIRGMIECVLVLMSLSESASGGRDDFTRAECIVEDNLERIGRDRPVIPDP